MAKHAKKAKKKTIRRRRSVRGISGIDGTSIALAVGGAVAAHKLQTFLAKDPTKTTMVNISPYAGLALGLGLPFLVKNPMVGKLAFGMAVMGGVQVLKKMAPGLIGYTEMVPVIAATSNKYRQALPKPSVNGVGYPLPLNSAYKSSMSVVNGISGTFDGSGAASAY